MARVEIVEFKGQRFLFLDDLLWMWDLPQERALQNDIAKQAAGEVLVAGYGLGIVSGYLLANPRVTSVTTVEKYPEVIEQMEKYGPLYGDVIMGDFYNLAEDKKYDCVIGDIWAEINSRYLDDYRQFKAKAGKLLKPGGLVLAWGADYFEYLLEKKLATSR